MKHDDDGNDIPLPPMREAMLDEDEVDALFSDIKELTEVAEILVKSGPGRIDDGLRPTLADARDLLRSEGVLAVQIRYRHDQAHWWDTLMRVGEKVRLVRVRHDFPDGA